MTMRSVLVIAVVQVAVCCCLSPPALSDYKETYMEWMNASDMQRFREFQARHMWNAMNRSADPCHNFYKYACGNWERAVPEDFHSGTVSDVVETFQFDIIEQLLNSSVTEVDSEAEIKAKLVYASCVNATFYTAESLGEVISSFGVFPAFYTKWDEAPFDWISLAAHADLYNISTFFRTSRLRDVVVLGPGTMPRYWKKLSKSRVDYERHIQKSLRVLNLSPVYVHDMALRLYAFEKKLESIPMGVNPLAEDSRYTRRTFRMMEEAYLDARDLQERSRKQTHFVMFSRANLSIDIHQYLQLYYGTRFGGGYVVAMEQYVDNLATLLAHTSPRTLADFFFWRIASSFTSHLAMTQEEQSAACVTYVTRNLRSAVVAMLSKRFFPEAIRRDITEIVTRIRAEVKFALQRSELLTYKSRKTMLQRLDDLKIRVLHEDYIFSDESLSAEYEDLHIVPDDFVKNHLELGYFVVDRLLRTRITGINPSTGWHNPLEVNAAFLTSAGGSLNINLALLFPPIYHAMNARFSNYGSAGYIVAHEIMHSFEEVLSDEILGSHTSLSSLMCVVDHYSNFFFPNIQKGVDGVKTLFENLADIDGLRIAYRAYRNLLNETEALYESESRGFENLYLSNTQAFFVSFAQFFCDKHGDSHVSDVIEIDEHAPNIVRVIAPLANSREFAEAFKCSPTALMNPPNKCRYLT